MAKVGRPGLGAIAHQQVWDLWKVGVSISEIARRVGCPPGSVFSILAARGGIYQLPAQRRSGTLSSAQREEISRGLAAGLSYRVIAGRLGCAASTISREVARNGGRAKYRAVDADDRAWQRARRPQRCILAKNPVLRGYGAARLAQDWSPAQIAGVLAKRYPVGSRMRVSHETIYRCLFIQSRGVLAKELQKHLRSGRPMRRSIHHSLKGQWRSQIIDAVPISQRPTEVENRVVPGHWEGDLLLGCAGSQLATIVERTTRFTVLVALSGRDMHTVTASLSAQMNILPQQLRRSLTWDRGMELAGHKTLSTQTGLQVYFADPKSPWQRGTNENTNRLLRQYFPKGTSMAAFTQTDLNAIATKLNTRPRKTLNFDTPADRLQALLH